ncbi:MAG: NTP transferase domain-containing protein [Planctomycetia bacterium]|nr:NTP transferase domain-containing protein [Planctomycetia bacterium]
MTAIEAVAVVLAAGKGTRMKSDLPKVLVPAAGRPMIDYVLDTLAACRIGRVVVVVGYRAEDVRSALVSRKNLSFVLQSPQHGTGHALIVCREALAGFDGPVVILTGDSPLIRAASITSLLDEFQRRRPACLLGTAHKQNPQGLGRIVRDAKGEFLRIVEEKDASPDERAIAEVNLSCYVFNCRDLFWALDRVSNKNASGEYYLTDCPRILLAAGKPVVALPVLSAVESLSVNTLAELAEVERALIEPQA